MFYFYIFYLTYSVLHGAIRRLVYDTRFAFYAVALNYVLAIILCVCVCVCRLFIYNFLCIDKKLKNRHTNMASGRR